MRISTDYAYVNATRRGGRCRGAPPVSSFSEALEARYHTHFGRSCPNHPLFHPHRPGELIHSGNIKSYFSALFRDSWIWIDLKVEWGGWGDGGLLAVAGTVLLGRKTHIQRGDCHFSASVKFWPFRTNATHRTFVVLLSFCVCEMCANKASDDDLKAFNWLSILFGVYQIDLQKMKICFSGKKKLVQNFQLWNYPYLSK